MRLTNENLRSTLIAPLACVLLGYILGVVSSLLPRLPLAAAAGQRAEVVVVVQTATPASDAPAQLPAEVAADVALSETLAGARDALRSGSADAPVQVVLFEDGQCPFCQKMSAEVVTRVISEHASTGDVAVTYRHYPFLGAESQAIAVAMECAGQQGKFWPFHDIAFADQRPENAGQVTDEVLDGWARRAGLDANAFAACRADDAVRATVEADLQLGRKLGVRGTPTLFVNGKRLVGAVPYAFVQSSIEEALRKTIT